MVVAAIVDEKDVILGFLGSASGLAGLTLVFLGLVVASRSSFAPGTSKRVLKRYRIPTAGVLLAFVFSILCVGSCAWWLISKRYVHAVYTVSVTLFMVQLILLLTATIIVVARVWRD
jgi:hypothetical protein